MPHSALSARERAIKQWSRNDPLVAHMLRHGHPVTRERYIALSFIGLDIPDEWTPEHEATLPDFLQLNDG